MGLFVRPSDGVAVRLPDGSGHLPVEGAEVEPSVYWSRRIMDGDVLVGMPHADKKKGA